MAGGALQLGGGSDYLTGSSGPLKAALVAAGLPTGSGPYTISAWIKPSEFGFNGIVGWGLWGSQCKVNAFRLDGNKILNYWWNIDYENGSLAPGVWTHVAVTYLPGTGRTLYVGTTGEGATETAYSEGDRAGACGAGGLAVDPSNFRIGITFNTESFVGLIDDVRIYNVALSDAEMAAVYSQGGAFSGATAERRPAPVIPAPKAVPHSYTTTENTPMTSGDVVAGNTNAEGTVYTPGSQPSHGTLYWAPTGTYTYTPRRGFVGEDTFSYRACLASACSTAVETITVTGANVAGASGRGVSAATGDNDWGLALILIGLAGLVAGGAVMLPLALGYLLVRLLIAAWNFKVTWLPTKP